MLVVLADAGFWIGLYDPRDDTRLRDLSLRCADKLIQQTNMKIILPWPIMYEILDTRCVKDPAKKKALEDNLRRFPVIRLDDSPYRERALEETLGTERPISLADMVVRKILLDRSVRIDHLLSFNIRDFSDAV